MDGFCISAAAAALIGEELFDCCFASLAHTRYQNKNQTNKKSEILKKTRLHKLDRLDLKCTIVNIKNFLLIVERSELIHFKNITLYKTQTK
jgi:hypothetical protein